MTADDGGALPDELSVAILEVLAVEPGAPVSLPRLAKRLGLGASSVMRHLRAIDGSTVGGWTGPGWVMVTQHDGRWTCSLTSQGLTRFKEHVSAGQRRKESSGGLDA